MAARSATPRPVPSRTCVVCRTSRPKRELVRIVRTPAGTVELDPSGRANGRGAYLCHDATCWGRAAGALARALEATLDQTIRDRLAAGPDDHQLTPTLGAATAPAPSTTTTSGGASHGTE